MLIFNNRVLYNDQLCFKKFMLIREIVMKFSNILLGVSKEGQDT